MNVDCFFSWWGVGRGFSGILATLYRTQILYFSFLLNFWMENSVAGTLKAAGSLRVGEGTQIIVGNLVKSSTFEHSLVSFAIEIKVLEF